MIFCSRESLMIPKGSSVAVKKDRQTTQWPTEEGQTDNTMANRRRTDRQHNGQKDK